MKTTSREVDLDVEVVVAEGVVLGRVEDLEQGRRGVAAPVGADLVDLVEQDHRVHRAGVAQGADDPSRQGADVGAAVAADLRLVVQAAEADADELAPERAGDRLADRGLAGARRADQGEDRPVGAAVLLALAALFAQLADGDELGDPFLHVLEAGVVGVQHLAGVDRVQPLLGALAPGHRDQPVQVAADHRGLGRLLALALEPAQLLLGLLGDRLRHLRLGDLVFVLGDQVGLVLAQLLADRLHLLAQEVLSLLFLGAGLDVLADLGAHLRLGQPLALQLDREVEAGGDVDRLQQPQLALVGDVGAEAGGVGQGAGLLDRAQEGGDPPVVPAQLEDLFDDGAVFARQVLGVLIAGVAVADPLHLNAQGVALARLGGPGEAAVQADHGGDRVAAARDAGLDHLGEDAYAPVLALVAGDEEDPLLLADVDRQGGGDGGEDDRLVERDQQIGHKEVQFL